MSDALIIWFCGMSGAGKTSIANHLEKKLNAEKVSTYIIDGDEIRNSIHKNLSFTEDDIKENNKLIAELCIKNKKLFDVIMVPIISPFEESRVLARKMIGSKFNLIFLKTSIDELINRDTKGLYKSAIDGNINNLIGFSESNPFEVPENPDLIIDTENECLEKSAHRLLKFIKQKS